MKKQAKRTISGFTAILLAMVFCFGVFFTGVAASEEAPQAAEAAQPAQEQPAPQAPEAPAEAAPEAPATEEPSQAAEEPAQVSEQPSQSAEEPAQGSEQPAQAAEEPAAEAPAEQPATETLYTLTVAYVDEQNALLPTSDALPENPAKVALAAGAGYTVALPAITGYACTVDSKTVTMGAQDETVAIVYAAVAEPAAQEAAPAGEVKLDDHLDELVTPEGPYVVIRCETGTEAELGDKVTLIAELHGFGGLTVGYQWQRFDGKQWTDIQGETGSKYVFSKLDSAAFGDWRVVVNVLP